MTKKWPYGPRPLRKTLKPPATPANRRHTSLSKGRRTSVPASWIAGLRSSPSGRSSTGRRKATSTISGWRSSSRKMVDPEKSGVLFTVDPVRGRKDRMVVEAVRGVGEQVVSGEVTPDKLYARPRGKAQAREDRGRTCPNRRRAAEARRTRQTTGGPSGRSARYRVGHGRRREVFLLQSRPVTTM